MSIYDEEKYRGVLFEDCNMRELLPANIRSKKLRKRWADCGTNKILCFFFFILSLLLLLGLTYISGRPLVVFLSLLSFVFLCTIFMLVARNNRLAMYTKRGILTNSAFITEIPDVGGMDDIVVSTREVLAYVYQVNVLQIYPDDTLEYLEKIQNSRPLRFELVLGVANRLNVEISDDDIEVLGNILYLEAKTVSDVIEIFSQTKLSETGGGVVDNHP